MSEENQIVLCTYKHCKCQIRELSKDDAIKIGKNIYHKQCNDERNDIKEIKRLYYDHISKTVVQSVLGKVINDIIYSKNIDAKYLLFCMEYIINNKLNLNTPYGLHYIIDNKNIKEQWFKFNKQKIKQSKISITETNDLPFYYNPTSKKGIDEIIKE